MIRHSEYSDEEEDDFDDPLPEDVDNDFEDDDSLPMMSCPHCRRAIVEDTQQCPHCGDWITPVETGSSKKWVYLLAVAVMLGLVVMWILK